MVFTDLKSFLNHKGIWHIPWLCLVIILQTEMKSSDTVFYVFLWKIKLFCIFRSPVYKQKWYRVMEQVQPSRFGDHHASKRANTYRVQDLCWEQASSVLFLCYDSLLVMLTPFHSSVFILLDNIISWLAVNFPL